ncbi:MAG: secondary thiamine-phosphate synthase enzyme YjbQ [Halobacteriota archaeon]
MDFSVETGDRIEVRDVTDEVNDALPSSAEGVCTVMVRHTTAGVVVNESEPRLMADIERAVAGLVPDGGWAHDELDGNADSHLRAMLVGSSVSLPVTDGELDLGTWQSVLLVECDGPRRRTVRVVV